MLKLRTNRATALVPANKTILAGHSGNIDGVTFLIDWSVGQLATLVQT